MQFYRNPQSVGPFRRSMIFAEPSGVVSRVAPSFAVCPEKAKRETRTVAVAVKIKKKKRSSTGLFPYCVCVIYLAVRFFLLIPFLASSAPRESRANGRASVFASAPLPLAEHRRVVLVVPRIARGGPKASVNPTRASTPTAVVLACATGLVESGFSMRLSTTSTGLRALERRIVRVPARTRFTCGRVTDSLGTARSHFPVHAAGIV